MSPGSTGTGTTGHSQRSRCAFWNRTRDRADCWTAAGWKTVVILTCCILLGLVSVRWKSGRVAETISNGTQALGEGGCAQDIPTRVMITKHGKAAHCRCDCPFFFESTCNPISELVFSSRFKRRFRKACLAAQRVMRTSSEPQGVCISLQSHSFFFHSCTPRVPWLTLSHLILLWARLR